MNWIGRAWRALIGAGAPEAPRRVNVSSEPDALLRTLRAHASDTRRILEGDPGEDEIDALAEQLEQARAAISRRVLLRRAAAVLVSSCAIAREGLRDVELPTVESALPGSWGDDRSDPLADILKAKREIWNATGTAPTFLLIGRGHQRYVLAHFGLDLGRQDVREELARELGMRVELAEAT